MHTDLQEEVRVSLYATVSRKGLVQELAAAVKVSFFEVAEVL